jgi:phosphoribosylformimino-5-aminoimidazole carboxamide ribotide isomerase
MKIIPAIDILNGKCVRLQKGNYSQSTIYSEDPLAVAQSFEEQGFTHLHVVDLDGAKANKIINYKSLKSICKNTQLQVDFGGGIKREEDIQMAFDAGAQQVTAGSIAVKQPEVFLAWLKTYGPERIILGADAKDRKIASMGWQESSEYDVVDFIKFFESQGVKQVICTDIEKDGMLNGPSFNLYKEILKETSCQLIASGGVHSIVAVKKLKALGCKGVIIGKAIYEGSINLKELSELC